jgi:uncharacterized protein (TIGR02246 family)
MICGNGLARCIILVFLAGVGCAVSIAQPVQRAEGDAAVTEITRLVSRYVQAADAADTKLASEVWANVADVSMIYPGGHERGWEAIKTNFYEKAMGGMFSERKLNIKDVVVHAYRDAAWVEFAWEFVAKLRANGAPLTNHGRESQVYRKSGGRWRLVHVHYSAMPVPR